MYTLKPSGYADYYHGWVMKKCGYDIAKLIRPSMYNENTNIFNVSTNTDNFVCLCLFEQNIL